jgi:hypothetical protein
MGRIRSRKTKRKGIKTLSRNEAVQTAKYAKYAKEDQGESVVTRRGIPIAENGATRRERPELLSRLAPVNQRVVWVFSLFPTKEGGEGWGEEDFRFELRVPLSPALSPFVPHGREGQKTIGSWARKAPFLRSVFAWFAYPAVPSMARDR